MACLNAHFLPVRPERSRRPRCLWAIIAAMILAVSTAAAEVPAYVREALATFNPEVPPDWAYTVMIEHDGHRTTERFDPSRVPEEQWSLLLMEGRGPTADERTKYFKYKAAQAPGAMQATFHRNDIEPGTIELAREGPEASEFTCGFRAESANSDKMLAHLRLHLFIARHQARVEKFSLELREPYSPVLGVKMRELRVEMNFAPSGADRPALPVQSSSHFSGRIFLIPVEENLRYVYSDFLCVH